MRSPQLDPTTAPTLACLHRRLIDRIRSEHDEDPPRYRCLECGAVIEDEEPQARPST